MPVDPAASAEAIEDEQQGLKDTDGLEQESSASPILAVPASQSLARPSTVTIQEEHFSNMRSLARLGEFVLPLKATLQSSPSGPSADAVIKKLKDLRNLARRMYDGWVSKLRAWETAETADVTVKLEMESMEVIDYCLVNFSGRLSHHDLGTEDLITNADDDAYLCGHGAFPDHLGCCENPLSSGMRSNMNVPAPPESSIGPEPHGGSLPRLSLSLAENDHDPTNATEVVVEPSDEAGLSQAPGEVLVTDEPKPSAAACATPTDIVGSEEAIIRSNDSTSHDNAAAVGDVSIFEDGARIAAPLSSLMWNTDGQLQSADLHFFSSERGSYTITLFDNDFGGDVQPESSAEVATKGVVEPGLEHNVDKEGSGVTIDATQAQQVAGTKRKAEDISSDDDSRTAISNDGPGAECVDPHYDSGSDFYGKLYTTLRNILVANM